MSAGRQWCSANSSLASMASAAMAPAASARAMMPGTSLTRPMSTRQQTTS